MRRCRRVVGADEEPGRHDRGAALARALGLRELVQHVARLVGQPAADDVRRGAIDEIPVVDAVVPAQVEIVQRSRCAAVLRLARAWKSMIATAPRRTS
jgi:hypothetical protein